MSQLHNILKELKRIEPHSDFSRSSRMQVLHTPRSGTLAHTPLAHWHMRIFDRLSSPALVLAGFATVIILSGSLYAKHKTAPYLAALNVNRERDIEEFKVQLNLAELASYEQSEQMIQVALREAAAKKKIDSSSAPKAPQENLDAPLNSDIDKALELML